ncbi:MULTISPECIES: D-alanyl-D-alanine carboxypeptidase family protein [unclassified Sporosarcina]|uniref:M15 family metallopeptidase n=1 Tax=unclassified Sporosarcina TaxID=2647733 RepID=UPI000C171FA1|nr:MULTISPECIES: M15 family metallopeptidase [unclassified Sporosarcina]PID06184.1 D-alanyl-D-alanine carboxypeptidase [Sporosarcina sp. P30]PID09378.1 D-alanyl-D-alanine carboxypeptidase [Sporosarcina sp. P31]PID12677.1 D-alanyl-D-alanine carboxypeptidase [Sporosarcina sp. P32b]
MRNKNDELSSRKRRRKNKWINGGILLLFIVLISSVIWIGTNGWNMEKAVESIQNESESTTDFQEIDEPADSNSTDMTGRSEENTSSSDVPSEELLRETEQPIIEEDSKEEKVREKESEGEAVPPSNPTGYIKGQKLPKEPKLIKGVLLANKQYPLPEDYAPGESEEAREAFDELAASAVTSGINLQAFSTYRSYDYQVTLYNRYVERDGQEAADRYSARPGYSEHQTGLAFDIGEVNHEKHWASNSFGDTEAAKWLAANAHQYGFILRYPEGKEDKTGYMHESWHYRYVGKDKAEQIFKRNITLEEYLGVP